MEIATIEERTILTFYRDYGELIFKYNFRPPSGVIYLRLANYVPDEPGKIVDQLLKQNLQTDNLLLLTTALRYGREPTEVVILLAATQPLVQAC